MRLFLCVLFTLLFNVFLWGQTYIGKSTDKKGAYKCLFQINKDSSIFFRYNGYDCISYGEYIGTINKIDDTLFHVAAILDYGHCYTEPNCGDSCNIHIDSSLRISANRIMLYNKKGLLVDSINFNDPGNSIMNFCSGYLYYQYRIPFGKKISEVNKKDYFIAKIIRGNKGQLLTFRFDYGAAYVFEADKKIEFDIVIKKDLLWTTQGLKFLQMNKFKLKK